MKHCKTGTTKKRIKKLLPVLFSFFGYLLIPVIGYSATLKIYNPGSIYVDYINDGIGLGLGFGHPSNWHSELFSVYTGAMLNWTNCNFTLMMEIQLALYSLVIAYFATTIMLSLRRQIQSKKIRWLVYFLPTIPTLIVCVLPPLVCTAETFNADIFAGIFYLIFTCQVFKIIDTRGTYFLKPFSLVLMAINSAILISLRTQMVAVIVGVFIISLIAYKRYSFQQTISVLMCVTLLGGWNIYMNFIGVTNPSQREMLSQPLQEVGAVYKNKGNINDDQAEFFGKFGSSDWWSEKYNPVNADPLRGINQKMPDDANASQFVGQTLVLCSQNINICSQAFYEQSKVWFNPNGGPEVNFDYYRANPKDYAQWIKNSILKREYNSHVSKKNIMKINSALQYPFNRTSIIEQEQRINYEKFWAPSLGIIGNFALPFILLLITLIILLVTFRYRSLLLLLVPFIFWLTLIFFGTVNFLYRLIFPMAMVMPFVVLGCFVLERKNRSHKVNSRFLVVRNFVRKIFSKNHITVRDAVNAEIKKNRIKNI
ncbi:MAG: DUF6020 family protein [Candidatus Ancillula sp.]|jgi:hypothetical protein|nr:DUF6020 family protein [Candidatus Ancillula sp.]